MAKRKSPPKKAAKKVSAEDVIIDGIAEEVDLADVKAQQTKPKPAAKHAEKTAQTPSKLSIVFSLIAVLFGISGLALGGLAYLSLTSTADNNNQAELTRKVVEDHVNSSLVPIYDQIIKLEASLKRATDKQVNSIGQTEYAQMIGDIAEVEATLAEIVGSTNLINNSETNQLPVHHHDDYARLEDINTQLLSIKGDIENLKAEQHNAPIEPTEPEAKDAEGSGWWNNLLGAFSIKRINNTSEQGTE